VSFPINGLFKSMSLHTFILFTFLALWGIERNKLGRQNVEGNLKRGDLLSILGMFPNSKVSLNNMDLDFLQGALIVSAWCVLLVVGRPQAPVANAGTPAVAAAGAATTANKAPTGNVSVVKDARDPLDGKGAYKYDIELSDGTKFEQEGATEAPGMGETEPSVVIKGSYSYVSPDGTPVNIMYIANKGKKGDLYK